jgi:hypothetical protein
MSTLITTSNQFRAEVLRNDKATLRQLSGAYTLIERSLRVQLNALMRDIADAQKAGKTINADWLRRSFRYQQLIRQVKAEVATFSNGANRFIQAKQQQAIDLGQMHATGLIEAAMPDITFARLPTEAINELIGVLENGSPLSKVLDRLGGQAASGIKDALVSGLASGHGAAKIAREIRNAIDVPRWKALQISRTEIMRSYRAATLRTYQENSDVLNGWIWTASLGPRCCIACFSLHGTFFPLSKTFFPAHVSCFPAGVSVTGPGVRATSTRWYEGELVDLQFSSGKNLSVTPNHPILTPNGWIAAGLLNEGSNVICSLDGEAAARFVDPDDYQVPTLIENVTQSRFSESGMISVSVPTASEDFHGDGSGSDVSIIRTNGELLNAINNTPLLKQFNELELGGRSVGAALLSRFGASDLFVKGLLSVGSGSVSGNDVSGVFFGSPLCHHHAVGLHATPSFNSGETQSALDGRSRNSEFTSQSVLGFPGNVATDDLGIGQSGSRTERSSHLLSSKRVSNGFISEEPASLQLIAQSLLMHSKFTSEGLHAFASNISFDRVLNVSRRGFSGHVYNLETKTGWYIANGILTHNCRCTSIPSVKGSDLSITTGAEVFAEYTPERQLEQLGPTRYEMYASGEASLDDFVILTRDRDWGGAYQVRPLYKLKRSTRAA